MFKNTITRFTLAGGGVGVIIAAVQWSDNLIRALTTIGLAALVGYLVGLYRQRKNS